MTSGNRYQSSMDEHEVEGDESHRPETDTQSESNNQSHTDNSQGSTSRPQGTGKQITFDKYGRPCGVDSEKFVTDIGKITRAHARPAIDSWTIVPQSIKDTIWNNIVVKYEVPEIYKANILSKANVSWKNWKHQLRVSMDENDTIAERKRKMPEQLIAKRENWEEFVDFSNTDVDRERRKAGKKAREAVELLHNCESPTGEINRSLLFAETHLTKTTNDPESTSAPDVKIRKIIELVAADPDAQKDINNDAVAQEPDESDMPASSCFIRGKTIAIGSYNTTAPPKEHTYSVVVEEIFDRDAELYDEKGKIGDVMIGQVINWPKPSVNPFRQ
ncbi:hypothetical protein MKW94_006572 [Papaver nudicaule]|uniref:Transposase Tnp1/En/Spm-like domain-containing protein n=1 Tax=Papaver nudicaule TaxID=74823 RepID=A0AA41S3K6_PAPNU|nr:hypothetical protein [Papaver nudicaule]